MSVEENFNRALSISIASMRGVSQSYISEIEAVPSSCVTCSIDTSPSFYRLRRLTNTNMNAFNQLL